MEMSFMIIFKDEILEGFFLCLKVVIMTSSMQNVNRLQRQQCFCRWFCIGLKRVHCKETVQIMGILKQSSEESA
jgi:hypothetical protein